MGSGWIGGLLRGKGGEVLSELGFVRGFWRGCSTSFARTVMIPCFSLSTAGWRLWCLSCYLHSLWQLCWVLSAYLAKFAYPIGYILDVVPATGQSRS